MSYRFSVKDPITKKVKSKTFSKTKYQESEAMRLGAEWIAEQQALREAANTVIPTEEPIIYEEQEIEKPIIPVNKVLPNISTEQAIQLIQPMAQGSGLTLGLIGSSGSGKTTFLLRLLEENSHFQRSVKILVSPNISAPIYHNIKRDELIACSDEYRPELLSDVYLFAKTYLDTHGVSIPFTIILDDVIDAASSTQLKKSIATYRNVNISTIVSIQSPAFIARSARASFHWFALFRMNTTEMIKILIDNIGISQFLEGTVAKKIIQYSELTSNYHFILVNFNEGLAYVVG